MESHHIRIRACLAVIHNQRILLVPHYDTDAGAVQWNLPGGKVEFGEVAHHCAIRELREETGITVAVTGLLDVSEVILPDQPWHSLIITYLGQFTGGALKPESVHPYVEKYPRWFSAEELQHEKYHLISAIRKALEM